jgi:transcriptional regulator with XRE-family HTH domain
MLQPGLPTSPVTLVAVSTLTHRLEAALKHGGKTRSDLMRVCKASRQAVNKWFETNAKNLKMEHLFAVADECKVEARWLATGEGSMALGGKSQASLPSDIPQRRIDLIRMYGRLPDEVRLPIRQLIETLSWQQHPGKAEYVKRQKARTTETA